MFPEFSLPAGSTPLPAPRTFALDIIQRQYFLTHAAQPRKDSAKILREKRREPHTHSSAPLRYNQM